jgi:RNA polymerase sigma-70 factor (ECF subfamily)
MGEADSSDRARDERFFTDLLAAAQWAVYDFVRGLTGENEAARDITQDVFVDVWRAVQRRAAPFAGARNRNNEQEARAWLFHVAYQRAVSARRRQRLIAWEPLDDDTRDVERAHAPRLLEDQVVEAEVVRVALLNLGPDDAACLLLNVVHGYTTAEIARIVEISPDAAKKRLSRAKSRLRSAYLAQGERPERHDEKRSRPDTSSQERTRP